MKTKNTTKTFDHRIGNAISTWNWFSLLSINETPTHSMRPTFGDPKCKVVYHGQTAPLWAHLIPGTEDEYLVTWPQKKGGNGAFSELYVKQAEIRTKNGLEGFALLVRSLTGMCAIDCTI